VLVSSGTVSFGLTLRAIGYGTSLRPVGAVAPRVRANRVLYAHPGLQEWYANGPLGLEQGFTLPRAPSGDAAGPLTLSLALSGGAHVSLAGGRSLSFSHSGGTALRYGGLVATDATGRALHSWLQLGAGTVSLRVDTRDARYPLRIDPLVQQGSKLTAPDKSGFGLFGISVALSADGSTALIGAPGDGVVWVFSRSGASWTQQGTPLTGSEQSPGEAEGCGEEAGEESGECAFGRSVALSADGNTALIGSPRNNERQGAAWVFTRSGTTWTQGAKLTGGEETSKGHFGRSVALSADGNTALVGGPADRGDRGAAWMFTRSGSSWIQQGSVLTGGGESGEGFFGVSVALSADGNTALIGSPGDAGYVGAAWAFTRSGSTWTQQGAKLTGAEEGGEGRFGYSVGLSSSGETALIGGRSDNDGAGAAWVFTRTGSTWTQQGSKLTGGEEEGGEGEFGYSAALSSDGHAAVIGAPRDEGHGAAWVFDRVGTSWTQQGAKLAGGSAHSWIGESVAVSSDGTSGLAGAPHENGKAGTAWPLVDMGTPPAVTKVNPNEGPAAGGTTVTISGTNLGEASAVNFGSRSAPGFTVNSASSITAVSPAGKGTVDVTVTTPAGTDIVSSSDRFSYLSAKGTGPPRPTVTNVSPEEGPAEASTGSGGVLGFGPIAGSSCTISLRSRSISVQSHSQAALKLLWRGKGICSGKLKLTVKTKAGHKRFKTKTIGTGTFSIPPGAVRTVRVKLNAAGRALLKAGHGRLGASIAIVKLSPGPAQARTASVRLVLQKTQKATTRKK
jgi:hypothetical protein